MFSIFKKEVASFFNSLIAYIVIGIFLLLMGLIFWLYPNTNILDYGYAEMDMFFEMAPYVLLFFIPAITMRMLSEELQSGTLELLLTKPISLSNIILGKYFSCVFILALSLIPTFIYYYTLYRIGNPIGNIDTAAVIGSYFGLLLLGSVYAAIGIFMSSLTKSQVVAFLLSAICSYFFYQGVSQLSGLFSGSLQFFISYLGLDFHYNSLGKGVIDTRNILYLTGISLNFLLLTLLSLNSIRK